MNFRASFCDPFKPDVQELGSIAQDKIMEMFHDIQWAGFLSKMKEAQQRNVHYSPSLEIENSDNKNGLSVSALDGGEWYIFFKRPKRVKVFFGLTERLDPNYTTELHGQTESNVKECLDALIRNDLRFLEDKIK